MKLGYINYLNCYPLYYHMLEKEPLPGVEIIRGYPSELNRLMRRGELDMSPISAAAYADMASDVVLLPDFCLSSIGYVRSVILRSTVPVEDLHCKRVGLSRASETSVVLLKILLERYYGVEPVYQPVSPKPSLEDEGCAAALIIGDEAMLEGKEQVPYTYDLGDLWLKKTGFPVVFAVFAVRESVLEARARRIEAVVSSFHKSLTCLEREPEALIQNAAQRYPDIPHDIHAYLLLLQYRFSQELKDALNFYFSLAGQMGLLSRAGPLRFMDIGGRKQDQQDELWTKAGI